jgi:hypothetical protein
MTDLNRRTLLASAGVAAFTSFLPVRLGAETTEAEQANTRIVATFCAAWSTRDLQRILPLLADDCVYRMTETTPAANGHAGVTESASGRGCRPPPRWSSGSSRPSRADRWS